MTGHRSDEQTDVPQERRSTDSESATESTYPTPQQASVVQDSPGTTALGMEEEGGGLDEQGNMKLQDGDPIGQMGSTLGEE
ncbi:hypothetical protein QOL99_11815 [Deinococcus sp. MIMF12]|uniref:Uncharacterized protein n=1 Tax=Deinococcus rhizophilus TaxID=3049544 RepID=A0ABT7JIF0_9DEIO|nr:hypothetical protein [Deinococcus rhizophilus]MDL2344833.1 hypothetical protein [Deinococcus rhizophilus]